MLHIRADSNGSPLNQLTLHPGFDILSRILSGGPLLTTILTIVTAGLDTIENNVAGTPLFTSCMLRSLRIIRRVLQIQAPFLEVFLPALAESSISLTPEKLARLKGQQPIDQSFLYHSEVVVQIAFLVACEQEEEIALLSIQILTLIADSPFFDVQQKFPDQSRTKLNRLVGLLQASPETLRIQEAFVQRLDEDIPESELDSRAVGESNGDEEDSSALRRAVRSSILDLFLANTRTDRSAPNIAHLLLGFDSKGRPEDMDIEDPAAADTKRTSLHVVLELLAQNVSSDETEASVSKPNSSRCIRSMLTLFATCRSRYSPDTQPSLQNATISFTNSVFIPTLRQSSLDTSATGNISSPLNHRNFLSPFPRRQKVPSALFNTATTLRSSLRAQPSARSYNLKHGFSIRQLSN